MVAGKVIAPFGVEISRLVLPETADVELIGASASLEEAFWRNLRNSSYTVSALQKQYTNECSQFSVYRLMVVNQIKVIPSKPDCAACGYD